MTNYSELYTLDEALDCLNGTNYCNMNLLYESIINEMNNFNNLVTENNLEFINEKVDFKEIFKNIYEKIKTFIDKIIDFITKTFVSIGNKEANIKKDEKDDKKDKTYQDFDIIIKFNDDKSEKFDDHFLKNAASVVSSGSKLSSEALKGFRKDISFTNRSNTYVDKETVDKIDNWVEDQRYPVSTNLEKKEDTISYSDFLDKCNNIRTECRGVLEGFKYDLNIIKRNASVFNLSSNDFSNPYERYRRDLARVAQEKCSEILKILTIANYYTQTVSRISLIATKALKNI